MMFSPGSSVVVLTLGKKKGVVVEAGRGGRYRVQVGNTVVSCRETELAATDPKRSRRRAAREPEKPTPRSEAAPASTSRVDLHGLSVEGALAVVLKEIDRALSEDIDRIEVVHGKGSGRLRDALHRELATISAVSAFRLDPHNAGVTWIYL